MYGNLPPSISITSQVKARVLSRVGHSILPKLLFGFTSDTKTETQIGRYSWSIPLPISKPHLKVTNSMGYFFHDKMAAKTWFWLHTSWSFVSHFENIGNIVWIVWASRPVESWINQERWLIRWWSGPLTVIKSFSILLKYPTCVVYFWEVFFSYHWQKSKIIF